jgi:hypothetical protein
MKRIFLISFFIAALSLSVIAQDKLKIKFGDVAEKDFTPKAYAIDSSAEAVILADIGTSEIIGNNKGWFSLRFKRFRRVHILNKNGYDIANVSIYLYTNGVDEEVLDKLKATTYSLENGKVVETKLDVKNSVFKDKIDKNRIFKKFTMPNVKEGSIIEYEYTIESDYLENLQPWEFQGSYPRLWSEYNLSLPDFLGYVFLTQGYRKYDINQRKQRTEIYRVTDSRGTGATDFFNLTSGVSDYHWVMKEVTALKEENFTTSVDNHISKIEFQLSELREPLRPQKIMGTWPSLTEKLLQEEMFGMQLGKENNWLKDDVKPVIAGATSAIEKAKKIFDYIRDNYTCTDHTAFFMRQTMKNLVKTKNGSVAELNLLLTAMLRYADVEADPVILSTRSNGYSYALYPLRSQYNYVISRAMIDGEKYFLDASEPRMGFGYLPVRCYNGHARVINAEALAEELLADDNVEKKKTIAFLAINEKGNISGSLTQNPGYYESYSIRNRIKDNGKEKLAEDIAKVLGSEYKMSNLRIDSLNNYEELLDVHYDFEYENSGEDIIYFNPMLGEATKENPFKSAERTYPVEMPYTMDETFTLQMEIPAGYEVDELPKSMVVKLNEQDEGVFEYRISKSGGSISFRSKIKINRAFFMPEEYEMLREFFNLIVSKQAEQIVFKKKKS